MSVEQTEPHKPRTSVARLSTHPRAHVLVQFVKFGIVGAVNGFLLNRRWTFREHVGDALTPVRWGIVQTCGLGVNEGLLYVFVHDARLDKLIAQVCATAVVTVSTFFVNRAWTFRMHPAVAADAPRPAAS